MIRLFLFLFPLIMAADPFPIQFSIPECKVVKIRPNKDRDFAYIVPGEPSTYIYDTEDTYYEDYQRSFYAITCAKSGWDCLRHYEILANGCIPYFLNLDRCSSQTMTFLPKDLIKEAMQLPGVTEGKIDHTKFDRKKYDEIQKKIFAHLHQHLTTKKMAEYLLKTLKYSGNGKILFLSKDIYPDYLRCLTLIGSKELLGDRIIDVPKVDHLYKSYPAAAENLYGKGFTYTKIIDDLPIDRDNIEERITHHEFDLVVYGSIHRGTPYLKLVSRSYAPQEIAYICGEDAHQCKYFHLHNLFLREY